MPSFGVGILKFWSFDFGGIHSWLSVAMYHLTPIQQGWMEVAILEITSQGAESASWMKVAIPSLASTSNLNHNYETYDAGGFQYSLSIKMFLQHKYFLSIVVNTKYFTQVVEISWPLSPNKVISYSERQNLRMATFHFHPTRSFCTVRDKHWEWPLSSSNKVNLHSEKQEWRMVTFTQQGHCGLWLICNWYNNGSSGTQRVRTVTYMMIHLAF